VPLTHTSTAPDGAHNCRRRRRCRSRTARVERGGPHEYGTSAAPDKRFIGRDMNRARRRASSVTSASLTVA
jgi:hypothetical protein